MFDPIGQWRSLVTWETSRYTPYQYVKRYRCLRLILAECDKEVNFRTKHRMYPPGRGMPRPYVYNVIRV